MTTGTKEIKETQENAQNTQPSAMEVIALLLKQNNELLAEVRELRLNGNGVIKKTGTSNAAKPVIDTYTGRFYHAESAAGAVIAVELNLKERFNKDGSRNTRVFYSIPNRETRFIPYVGTLTKADNGTVVQPPAPPVEEKPVVEEVEEVVEEVVEPIQAQAEQEVEQEVEQEANITNPAPVAAPVLLTTPANNHPNPKHHQGKRH